MAIEPISIFSHRIDPHGVVELLRGSGYDLEVAGPDDQWEQVAVVFSKKGWFRKTQLLTLGHDTEYYDGPDWSKQVTGMQGISLTFPQARPATT